MVVPPVVARCAAAAAAQWVAVAAPWAAAATAQGTQGLSHLGPRLETVVMGTAHSLMPTPGKVLEMFHLVRQHS